MKKVIFLFLFLTSGNGLFAQTISADALRREYHKVSTDSVSCAKLYNKVTKSADSDNVIKGYKGAITAAMANHVKEKKEKLRLFNTGKKLLEESLAADSSNIELRFLRFTIQNDSPKILGYNKQMNTDKNFIIKNYSSVKNKALKQMLYSYLMQASYLTEAEKQKITQ